MNINQVHHPFSPTDSTRITPLNSNLGSRREPLIEGNLKESHIDTTNKKEKKINGAEDLNKIAEDANKLIPTNQHLRFQVHEDTERILVEVVDLDTDEVIKELPPKEFLDMIARIREYVGLLIDEKI